MLSRSRERATRPLTLFALAVVMVLAVLVGTVVVSSTSRSRLESGFAAMPSEALRIGFTDWAQVRAAAGGDGLVASPGTRSAVRGFLHRAFEQDLVSTSAVDGSTYALSTLYGFSPLDVETETFGQSRRGAVDVLRLGPGSASASTIEDNLASLGYRAPSDGGLVWRGGVDLVPQIAPSLTPVVQHVAVVRAGVGSGLAGAGGGTLVALSDNAEYLESAVQVLTGDRSSVLGSDRVADVVGHLDSSGDPATALVLARDYVCEALAMSQAPPSDEALGERLVAQAGGVAPLVGYGVAVTARDGSSGSAGAAGTGRSVVLAMELESDDQAASDAPARARLAVGEAVGQGGTFPERFRLTSAEADGATVVLTGPVPAHAFPMADLATGPVLLATC